MTLQFVQNQKDKDIDNSFDYSVLNYISVTKPYFALQNLRNKDEYIYADFSTELKNVTEDGSISTPEVGRHMAILGSLALARENPRKEKHYYLATKAHIKCFSENATDQTTFTACVKLESFHRKKGFVSGSVFNKHGDILYTIEVTYMILVSSIFERMFENNKINTPLTFDFNPYINDTKLNDVNLDIETSYANGGVVDKNECIGHFHNYPALPVARLGMAMGNLGSMHFMHLNPNEKKKFKVTFTEIIANQLVFVGEEIKYRTELVDPNPEKGMIIRTIAYTDKSDFVAEAITNYHY